MVQAKLAALFLRVQEPKVSWYELLKANIDTV